MSCLQALIEPAAGEMSAHPEAQGGHPATRVRDKGMEPLPAPWGTGWQPARRLPAAAVSLERGSWPIGNRPQLAKLPHNSALCLACPYARPPGTLRANRAGVRLDVAHPATCMLRPWECVDYDQPYVLHPLVVASRETCAARRQVNEMVNRTRRRGAFRRAWMTSLLAAGMRLLAILALAGALPHGLSPVLVARPPAPQTGIQSDEVAIIVNDADPGSRAIAAYYSARRGIPAAHICHLRLAADEEIGRDTFERDIETPVGGWLKRRNLVEKILVLVTTSGVPLKVKGSFSPTGTASSVDSELALLYNLLHALKRPPLEGGVPNPFYQSNRRFQHPQFAMYLVTRLTAYSLEDVKAMIDRSLQARNRGTVVLDGKGGGMDEGELWLRAARNRLPPARVVFDDTARVIENVGEVIGYASWGSNDPHRTKRMTGLHWLPGGIATEYVSTDARTFREPPAGWQITTWNDRAGFFAGSPQSLAGDLLREGATGVSGNVYEPYLIFTSHPDLLFPAYLNGWTLAESYWRSIPLLSWMNVVVGDPLCHLESQ